MRLAAVALAVSIARLAAGDPDRSDVVAIVGFDGDYKFEPFLVDGVWQNREAFSAIRPNLHGTVYKPWIDFKTSVELASNPPYLLDAYVTVARWKQLQFRFGQLKTPFSRAEWFGRDNILFPDQPVVVSYFATGRDKGAIAFGTLGDSLQYWAGAFGGSPLRQFTTISGNYLFEARATYNPDGAIGKTEYPYMGAAGHAPAVDGISASLEGYVGKIESAVENFDPSSFGFTTTPSGITTRSAAVGADVFEQGPAHAIFAEAFYRRTEPEGAATYRSWGVWGQASYALVPDTLDCAIRIDYVDPSVDLADDTFEAVEAQLAWYIDAPHLIARLRYGLGRQHSPGAAQLGDVRLPIGFVGTIQVFTAQLGLSF